MTTTDTTPAVTAPAAYRALPFDLYRDIHKGIRSNLFELVNAAGRLDPSDRDRRIEVAARVKDLVDFLVLHAEHEDRELEGPIAAVLPDTSAAIAAEHAALEAEMQHLLAVAYTAFDRSRDDSRAAVHELYLSLASFTSRYLAHQDVEERVVMPRLVQELGVSELLAIHGRILASITPEQMGWSLVKMLPAMNLDDRFEMLAGMRAEAPPHVFDGVVALAADLLDDADFAALAARLEIDLSRTGVPSR